VVLFTGAQTLHGVRDRLPSLLIMYDVGLALFFAATVGVLVVRRRRKTSQAEAAGGAEIAQTASAQSYAQIMVGEGSPGIDLIVQLVVVALVGNLIGWARELETGEDGPPARGAQP
jgi:hypothetical protein